MRNRTLPSQKVLSVCNITPPNKVCKCPSLRSRSSLWKVSRRSLRNVFFLCGFGSRSETLLSLRSWKRQLRHQKITSGTLLATVEQTVVAPALQVVAPLPDVAVGDTVCQLVSWCTRRFQVIRIGDRDYASQIRVIFGGENPIDWRSAAGYLVDP